VSAFTQDIIRYKKKVIERRVNQRYDSRISFKAGKYKIDPYHNNNANELEKISSMVENVFKENEFEIDSVKIISSSSPEGKFKTNEKLSKQRSTEIEKLITDLVIEMSQKYKTLHLHHGKLVGEYGDRQHDLNGKIIQCIIPENWQLLYRLIERDTILTNKKGLLDCFAEVEPDKRENLLSKYKQEYNYLKENIYPLLRKVSIELNLLRIGMVKDTIHTSEPDTLYTRGVNLLKKREYSKALEILIGYNDINTAIAHLSLGQDVSAYSILEKLKESAHQLYMMAIIHARKGEEQEAARLFLKSKELDIKMAYRGGLDPEISKLIEKYNLNKDLFE
jgi:tetratricopeptide (TPR) repeat protein